MRTGLNHNRVLGCLGTALVLSGGLLISGCKKFWGKPTTESADTLAVREPESGYLPQLALPEVTATAVPLDSTDGYLDIRGVGDSAWSGLRATHAPRSEFGSHLKKFDPSGKILRGDLNFINWESAVGVKCNSYFNVDYAFLSDPSAITDAYKHGFNLFGLANNHSEDCRSAVDPQSNQVPGAVATQRFMQGVSASNPILWHGVGENRSQLVQPATQAFTVKGRRIVVSFVSVAFQGWDCVESTCEVNVKALFENAKKSNADLRILSLHSQGHDAFLRGRVWAEKFITEFSGDVVFAHGPHTWAGVKVLKKNDGNLGVVFHGLGNFLHNQVAPNPDNMIGRVLLDLQTLHPKQVQSIPVLNNAYAVDVTLASPTKQLPQANFRWKRAELRSDRSVHVGFAQLP